MTTYIEARNISHSGWQKRTNTSNLTISFWVRATYVAQEFFVAFGANGDTASVAQYTHGFTIGFSINTWQRVVFQVPGDALITDVGWAVTLNWMRSWYSPCITGLT